MEPHVQFSESSLLTLNVCLAFIMFGVALEIKPEHFYQLRHDRKAMITGLLGQYIILPVITVMLIFLLRPSPGIALGMLLVAACPGGNASNFFTLLAKGHVALSVTLTAIISLLAFLITPVSFFFWSSWVPGLTKSIRSFEIRFTDIFFTMPAILLLPLLAGMGFGHFLPKATRRISKPVQFLSILILVAFILVALYNNRENFINHIASVFWLVVLHNGAGLLAAYYFSRLMKNSEAVNRTVAIETGIQNSGLGLVLIFTFFDGNGSMALVAAWWGVWHLVSGFLFAYLMQRKQVVTSA